MEYEIRAKEKTISQNLVIFLHKNYTHLVDERLHNPGVKCKFKNYIK